MLNFKLGDTCKENYERIISDVWSIDLLKNCILMIVT